MSFTYSGNPSATQLDLVRFLLNDTEATDYVIEDAEITYLVSTWNNAYLAASHGAKMISANFAKQATSKSVGDLSISYSSKSSDYSLLAQRLYEMFQSLYPPTPRVSANAVSATVDKDTSDPNTDFYTGQTDNGRVRPLWYR